MMIKQSVKLGVDFLPSMEGKWRKSVKKRNHMTKYDNERVFPRATLREHCVLMEMIQEGGRQQCRRVNKKSIP